MSKELAAVEQETAMTLTAADRNTWHVFSEDAVMQRRLEAVGAVTVKSSPDGISKWYTLPASQVSFRQAKKPLSDERKAQLSDQLRAMRQSAVITDANGAK